MATADDIVCERHFVFKNWSRASFTSRRPSLRVWQPLRLSGCVRAMGQHFKQLLRLIETSLFVADRSQASV